MGSLLPTSTLLLAGIGPRFGAAAIDVCVYGAVTFWVLVAAASVEPTDQAPALTLAALLAGGLIACFYGPVVFTARGDAEMRVMYLRVVD